MRGDTLLAGAKEPECLRLGAKRDDHPSAGVGVWTSGKAGSARLTGDYWPFHDELDMGDEDFVVSALRVGKMHMDIGLKAVGVPRPPLPTAHR